MKFQTKYNISYILILFLLLTSCREESMPLELNVVAEIEEMTQIFDFHFSSEGSYGSSTNFIVLSDINGKTLYDTLGTELDIKTSLLLDTGAIVNATVGFVKDANFSIVSYSEVKSGAHINLSRDWETDPCFQSIAVDGNKATLTITDLDQFHETINPFFASNSNTVELKGDTLVIEGYLPSRSSDVNYQIAIREQENSELMSIVTPKQDWNWDSETQSLDHTISFNSFSSTKEYEIDLDRVDKWSMEVKVCDKEGKYIASQSRHYYLEDASIKTIYLNQDIDIRKLKLNISSNNYPAGYSYNWIHESIPDKLNLDIDTEPTFLLLENEEFIIKNTFAYNLNVMNYNYGGRYDWTIISKGGEFVRFKKPGLPSQLFDTFIDLEDLLQNPNRAINTMYRTEDVIDDITKVHKSVIPRNENNDPDFNYSSKETTIDF